MESRATFCKKNPQTLGISARRLNGLRDKEKILIFLWIKQVGIKAVIPKNILEKEE